MPFVRRHRGTPALLRFGQPLLEVRFPLREEGGVRAVHLRELREHGLGDAPSVLRIQPVVRIAERMHVPHRPGNLAARQLENLGGQRCIEVAVATRLDSGVPALGDERRQPPDLEFAADHDQQVGAIQLEHEARLRLDEVRILISPGQRLDLDLVAADFTRNRGQIFGRRNRVDRGARPMRCRPRARQAAGRRSTVFFSTQKPPGSPPRETIRLDSAAATTERNARTFSEDVGAVGADGKQELEQQFVGDDALGIGRAAILSAYLAELARPVRQQS